MTFSKAEEIKKDRIKVLRSHKKCAGGHSLKLFVRFLVQQQLWICNVLGRHPTPLKVNCKSKDLPKIWSILQVTSSLGWGVGGIRGVSALRCLKLFGDGKCRDKVGKLPAQQSLMQDTMPREVTSAQVLQITTWWRESKFPEQFNSPLFLVM